MVRSAKLRGYVRMLLSLLLLLGNYTGFVQYSLHVHAVDKDSLFVQKKLGITTAFKSRAACSEYIEGIPSLLKAKGFMAASVDSVNYDSAGATIRLYTGSAYRWAHINTRQVEPGLLSAVSWNDKSFSG